MQIEGKVVLITGASEGIGAACARAFRDRGANVCLTARSEENLRAVADPRDLVIPADLLVKASPQLIVDETIAKYGRIDVLVNNAGAGLYEPAHLGSPELATRLFQLNLFAPLELIRCAVPHMKQQSSGTIVNVSSIAGCVSLPWFTLYSATKSALLSLTDGLRVELRRWGIHCICVCPGYVRTRFQHNLISGEVPPALAPLKQRWSISPEQCADAIADGVIRGARTVVTPRSGWLLIAAAGLFPSLVDRQLESILLRELKSPEAEAA
ncbi:MAG: SDR family NAD(P)-dependent oxidoreductase [Bryobacteraceae bacterium]|nr:SDR family NAD(P)-dependent oxidoreductase [Bryobacteraceae bacterium]